MRIKPDTNNCEPQTSQSDLWKSARKTDRPKFRYSGKTFSASLATYPALRRHK